MTAVLTPPAGPDPQRDATEFSRRSPLDRIAWCLQNFAEGGFDLGDPTLQAIEAAGRVLDNAARSAGIHAAEFVGTQLQAAAENIDKGFAELGGAVADALRDGLADIADAIRNRGKVTTPQPQRNGVTRAR